MDYQILKRTPNTLRFSYMTTVRTLEDVFRLTKGIRPDLVFVQGKYHGYLESLIRELEG